MKLRMALTLACSAALAFLYACSSSSSSSTPAVDYSGSCRELASRCHPVKTLLGNECHDLGHDGDDARCGPRKNECLAECPEVDASLPFDVSPPDAGGDAAANADAGSGPSAACQSYCTCMTATCATVFADEASCLTRCATFSTIDVECFGGHCEDAKTATNKDHDCEHASGAVACH